MDSSEPSPPPPSLTPSPFQSLLPSAFLAFRLVYIPASVFAHSGHGLPWLTALVGLAATFGLEALVRRGQNAQPGDTPTAPGRALAALATALVVIGLFPEEAPVAVILWAVTGALWPRTSPARTSLSWAGLPAGALLGLTGLFGPGSWLMAGLILLWGRRGKKSARATD